MTAGMTAEATLGRMLWRQDAVGDLLAYLYALDPHPLEGLLGLRAGAYQPCLLARDQLVPGGVADLLLVGAQGQPVAVVQLGTATTRARLSAVRSWAARLPQPPLLVYVPLDRLDEDAEEGWLTLPQASVFSVWAGSGSRAGWLGGEISSVLTGWDTLAEGPLRRAQGEFTPDIVVRRVARALHGRLTGVSGMEGRIRVGRTGANEAMVRAFQRPTEQLAGVWAGVDVRCRTSPASTAAPGGPVWLFRPCVESYRLTDPQADAPHGPGELVDLVAAMAPALTYPAITAALRASGHERLAGCLSPEPGQSDTVRCVFSADASRSELAELMIATLQVLTTAMRQAV